MSPEALRAGLYAIGTTLIAVGGFDDTLVAAGLPALGLISAGVAKILLAVGALAVGYAKTARKLGDFQLKDVSDVLRESLTPMTVPAAQAKAQAMRTDPGAGPNG